MREEKSLYADFDESYPDACCQGEAPPCSCACPFQVDVRDFISKYRRGSLDAAVKTFRNGVIFPRIVAELCPAPCEQRCPRSEVDSAIDLHGLEQAAVRLARSLDPINFNVPAKPERIAVIGAGPSGMAAALRLAAKKYQVTVYEKSGRIGGGLWEIMEPEIFLDDFATQGKYVSYELRLNEEITALAQVADYDAVYIATGPGGQTFGLTADADGSPQGGPKGVFIGGGVLGADTMWAIAQGAAAAINIEKYLKTGAMRFAPEKPRCSHIEMQTQLIEPRPGVFPADGVYSREEAMAEADRCLRCDCHRCENKCEFMQYWRLNPKQIANFTAFGLGDMNLEPKSHNRMVNACTGCGVCERVCPEHIPNGEQMLAARRRMFAKKKIPPAYHYFWVKDMAEALADEFSLLLPSPTGQAKYLLFPGCQLGASDPRYPRAAYELLRRVEPDTALFLSCCGAPAYWAGDQPRHEQIINQLRRVWREQGEPQLVCACFTCLRLLRQYAPDIPALSLYRVLAEAEGDGSNRPQLPDKEYALVDPCAAKFDATAREDISSLLDKMGVPHSVLYEDIQEMPCCGFGGNIAGADPGLAEQLRQNRVAADDRPYLTYCANCRDIFAGEGKEAAHIIDLLAGLDMSGRPAPHLDQRRANRLRAKALLTGEKVPETAPAMQLEISEELREIMDKELVYEEDIRRVISYAEAENAKFIDDAGASIGHLTIGLPTVWVEYKKTGENSYRLLDCYTHRMTVMEPGRDYEDCINNKLSE